MGAVGDGDGNYAKQPALLPSKALSPPYGSGRQQGGEAARQSPALRFACKKKRKVPTRRQVKPAPTQ